MGPAIAAGHSAKFPLKSGVSCACDSGYRGTPVKQPPKIRITFLL